MTMANTAAGRSDTNGIIFAGVRVHPLAAILLLAAVIRLPLAFWPNFHHPDEIFQYLEPAWRMLGHDSIVSWEWRYGMRGWLLPTVMAGPVAVGDWLVPGGMGAFVLPRLVVAIASLSIVASAWAFGARVSRTHATIAGLVAAIWFELVYFAPHTLGEPLSTAAILPAALLLTRATPSQRDLIGAGALLALAVLFRFQYAPAIATLAIGACWRHWRRLNPMLIGGTAVLAVSATVDAARGAVPFLWLIENIRQNLLQDRAAEFGVMLATAYLNCFWAMWSVAMVPLLYAVFRGWRHAPMLVWVAVVNIAFHSLIGHKEYRFIFLSVALLIIVAALGSVDWILTPLSKWRRFGLPLIAAGWISVSAALVVTGTMPTYWMRGIGAAKLAAQLRADPLMCGIALYDTPFYLLPGRDRLAGRAPLFALYSTDPLAAGHLPAATSNASSAFNRIVAHRSMDKQLPANFSARQCESVGGAEVCIFARAGGCTVDGAPSFTINDVLTRVDL
jgi:Alg9-like mannosyltransferase family